MDRVGAAEGVVEAAHLLEALVTLFIDALALWHLVEHGGLRLRVVFNKLHVLEDWRREMDLITKHVLFILLRVTTLNLNQEWMFYSQFHPLKIHIPHHIFPPTMPCISHDATQEHLSLDPSCVVRTTSHLQYVKQDFSETFLQAQDEIIVMTSP